MTQTGIWKLACGSFQRELPVPENIDSNDVSNTSIELRPVFQSIMDKIERLVRKQLQALEQKGHTPTVSRF